jgi:hypothetical protein
LKKTITKMGWWSGSRCRPWVQAPVPKNKVFAKWIQGFKSHALKCLAFIGLHTCGSKLQGPQRWPHCHGYPTHGLGDRQTPIGVSPVAPTCLRFMLGPLHCLICR